MIHSVRPKSRCGCGQQRTVLGPEASILSAQHKKFHRTPVSSIFVSAGAVFAKSRPPALRPRSDRDCRTFSRLPPSPDSGLPSVPDLRES
jgi:hypothetical protein